MVGAIPTKNFKFPRSKKTKNKGTNMFVLWILLSGVVFFSVGYALAKLENKDCNPSRIYNLGYSHGMRDHKNQDSTFYKNSPYTE